MFGIIDGSSTFCLLTNVGPTLLIIVNHELSESFRIGGDRPVSARRAMHGQQRFLYGSGTGCLFSAALTSARLYVIADSPLTSECWAL